MSSIKKELFFAVFYKAIDTYSYVIISFVVTMILSRILTPYDYGVVAIANVFLVVLLLVGTCGLNNAIIQNKNLEEKDYDNFFLFTLYAALVFAGIFFLISPLIAWFYNIYQLVSVCKLLAIVLFFNILNIVPNSLLIKEKRFAFIAKRTLVVYSLTGCLAILYALKISDIYSLLIMPLFSSIIVFGINYYRYRFRIRLFIQKESLTKVFKFSLYDFLYGLVNTLELQFDKLIIGKTFSFTLLAQYDKATSFTNLVIGNVNAIFVQSAYPILNEKYLNKEWLELTFRKFVKIISLVSFPLAIFICVSSREIIFICFGDQWDGAVDILRISSFLIPLVLLQSLKDIYFRIMDMTPVLMSSNLYMLLLKIVFVVLILCITCSLQALIMLIVGLGLLKVVYIYHLLYKHFGQSVIYAYKAILPSLFWSFLLVLGYWFSYTWIVSGTVWLNFFWKGGLFLIFGAGVFVAERSRLYA